MGYEEQGLILIVYLNKLSLSFPLFPSLSLSIFLSVSKWPYLPSTSKRIVSQKWVTMVSQCLCCSPHLARWLEGKRALQAGSEDGGLAQRFSSITEEMLGCILDPMRACCDAWCNLCTDECWQWQGSFWFLHESKTANFLICSKTQKPHAVCPYGSSLMILTAVWLSSCSVNECNKGKLASWHSGGHFICLQISLGPTQLSWMSVSSRQYLAVHLEGSLGDWLSWS